MNFPRKHIKWWWWTAQQARTCNKYEMAKSAFENVTKEREKEKKVVLASNRVIFHQRGKVEEAKAKITSCDSGYFLTTNFYWFVINQLLVFFARFVVFACRCFNDIRIGIGIAANNVVVNVNAILRKLFTRIVWEIRLKLDVHSDLVLGTGRFYYVAIFFSVLCDGARTFVK